MDPLAGPDNQIWPAGNFCTPRCCCRSWAVRYIQTPSGLPWPASRQGGRVAAVKKKIPSILAKRVGQDAHTDIEEPTAHPPSSFHSRDSLHAWDKHMRRQGRAVRSRSREWCSQLPGQVDIQYQREEWCRSRADDIAAQGQHSSNAGTADGDWLARSIRGRKVVMGGILWIWPVQLSHTMASISPSRQVLAAV